LKLADHVLNNEGSVEDLERQVNELWAELLERAKSKATQ
jgi:dephospho-CoA kinase